MEEWQESMSAAICTVLEPEAQNYRSSEVLLPTVVGGAEEPRGQSSALLALALTALLYTATMHSATFLAKDEPELLSKNAFSLHLIELCSLSTQRVAQAALNCTLNIALACTMHFVAEMCRSYFLRSTLSSL